MSSSSDFAPVPTPELRTGTWTRFSGSSSVFGDAVTDQTLSALAESTRSAARSQGYAVGWAEGRRAAREAAEAEAARVAAERDREDAERASEHRARMDALDHAWARLDEAVAEATARVDEQASTLALALTETIVGELRADVDAVRRALDLAPPDGLVALRVDPAALDSAVEHDVRLIPDPQLAPGDALAEYDEHVIDLRISTALDRVREALR